MSPLVHLVIFCTKYGSIMKTLIIQCVPVIGADLKAVGILRARCASGFANGD